MLPHQFGVTISYYNKGGRARIDLRSLIGFEIYGNTLVITMEDIDYSVQLLLDSLENTEVMFQLGHFNFAFPGINDISVIEGLTPHSWTPAVLETSYKNGPQVKLTYTPD